MWVFGLVSWLLKLGFGDMAGDGCCTSGCVCGVHWCSGNCTLSMRVSVVVEGGDNVWISYASKWVILLRCSWPFVCFN
ncbi:hypothetical protein L484_011887 [Morus notabilis]|uniref:Secreted protein n=1 Tax=Morus notabilis TaxID=981085 RepID=W9RZU0_9ROSA|nr:hypothetical protein L484_011887 [Morus notabilis]